MESKIGVQPTGRSHVLTVGLEDYFQVGAFRHLIDQENWYRFEPRFIAATQKTLGLLDAHATKATFFVSGWIADQYPELVRELVSAGHEVGSRGYWHRSINEFSAPEFHEDACRSREAIERACGQQVFGYRIADGWLSPQHSWVYSELARAGYHYDSSTCPTGFQSIKDTANRFIHRCNVKSDSNFFEVPLSTQRRLGVGWSIAGGNYFRQLPHWYLRKAIGNWDRQQSAPFVMYFHTWELDADQPRITAGGTLTRMRHYRNLDRMQPLLETLFQTYRFAPVAEHLQLQATTSHKCPDSNAPLKVPAGVKTSAETSTRPPEILAPQQTLHRSPRESTNRAIKPVTVVIPCFNEERTLPYLAKTLESVTASLANRYSVKYLFVDDCSTDLTWDSFTAVFGANHNCQFVRHTENRGVAAAISTGISRAQTEIVASMDCDCSYDPHELGCLLDLLTDDVDLVTASPYHPSGHVKNVPGWRLLLSKGLSRMYRVVLGSKLHTYTSCFRVYRRSAVVQHQITTDGFLGIAELLGLIALNRQNIVEHPAVLSVRIFGESKMKTLRTIRGHLRLLTRLAWHRMRKQPATKPETAAIKSNNCETQAEFNSDDFEHLTESTKQTVEHSTLLPANHD